MGFNFVDADTIDFDPQTYVRILIAIAKSDPENGPNEFAYVQRQARRLGVDYQHVLDTTDKTYSINKHIVTRLTALEILKDAIMLASLDRNFSLPERQRIYTYAEKLDVARKDVDYLEMLVKEMRQLNDRWQQLVASR